MDDPNEVTAGEVKSILAGGIYNSDDSTADTSTTTLGHVKSPEVLFRVP